MSTRWRRELLGITTEITFDGEKWFRQMVEPQQSKVEAWHLVNQGFAELGYDFVVQRIEHLGYTEVDA